MQIPCHHLRGPPSMGLKQDQGICILKPRPGCFLCSLWLLDFILRNSGLKVGRLICHFSNLILKRTVIEKMLFYLKWSKSHSVGTPLFQSKQNWLGDLFGQEKPHDVAVSLPSNFCLSLNKFSFSRAESCAPSLYHLGFQSTVDTEPALPSLLGHEYFDELIWKQGLTL